MAKCKEKSYIQKITPFVDRMRYDYCDEGDTPGPSLTPINVGDTIEAGSRIYFDTTKEAELLAWLQANVGPESKGSITLFSNHNENFQLQGMYEKSVDAYFIMVLDLGSSHQVGGYLYTSKAIEGWYENPGFVYGEHALNSDGSYTPLTQYEITEVSDVPGWNGILVGHLA